MNRCDKARWAKCATLADIGEAMCDWINGAVQQSPTYLGGPHGETIRHARILCAVNRQGTVTNGMNDNNEGCPNAHVDLFVALGRLYKLERIAWAHGLTTVDMPRRLKREMTGYFSGLRAGVRRARDGAGQVCPARGSGERAFQPPVPAVGRAARVRLVGFGSLVRLPAYGPGDHPVPAGVGDYVELARTRQAKGRVFRKHILNLGTLIHPKTGEKLTLDDAWYDRVKANFDSRPVATSCRCRWPTTRTSTARTR